MTLSRCADDAYVFRSIKVKEHFPPDAAKPLPLAMRLTEIDIADGKERGVPALFSTWDCSMTTVAQSFVMRQKTNPTAHPDDYRTVRWCAARVREIGAVELNLKLDVLHDPRPQSDGPGAAGHCGISGLIEGYVRAKSDAKLREREAWAQLVDACEPYVDGTESSIPRPERQ